MRNAFLVVLRLVPGVCLAALVWDLFCLVGMLSGPGLPVPGNRFIPASDLGWLHRQYVEELALLFVLPALLASSLVAEQHLSRPGRKDARPLA